MRGSDENASLYWLARMLEGGEDPLYVARRLVRFASEDIGQYLQYFTLEYHAKWRSARLLWFLKVGFWETNKPKTVICRIGTKYWNACRQRPTWGVIVMITCFRKDKCFWNQGWCVLIWILLKPAGCRSPVNLCQQSVYFRDVWFSKKSGTWIPTLTCKP